MSSMLFRTVFVLLITARVVLAQEPTSSPPPQQSEDAEAVAETDSAPPPTNTDAEGNPPPTKNVEPTTSTEDADPALKLVLATPQKCLVTFRRAVDEGNWAEAVECMDFSGFVASQESKTQGETLAYQLDQILDGVTLFVDQVPDDPERQESCVLTEYVEDLMIGGPLEDAKRNDFDRIVLSRSTSDSLWRFDPGTVKQIETIYENWKPDLDDMLPPDDGPKPTAVWLADQFPESLHVKHFLIPDYMWICLAAVVGLGFLADALVGFLALNLSQSWFRVERTEDKDDAVRQLWKPFGLLLQAMVWYYGTSRIGLPTWATDYLSAGLRFFTVFAGVWVLFRLVDLVAEFFAKRAEKTSSKFDDQLVPLLSKTMKIVASLLGLLVCAETFALPIKGLLGGLGLGGMALALASKDAVSNLFGSFTVLMDRPFEIGDWVITEDIEGTIEQVGFRSTRIRTFYNSVITLPNSRLTTAVVDNMGRRRYRRIKTVLGVDYNTTPEQLDAFCEGIRELIRRNPTTRKDYFHVYFQGFGESSLDILVYFFLRVPDWAAELRERHKLFSEVLRLAQELKIGFAFPTRTLHMHPETAPPAPFDLPHDNPERFGRESAARVFEQANVRRSSR